MLVQWVAQNLRLVVKEAAADSAAEAETSAAVQRVRGRAVDSQAGATSSATPARIIASLSPAAIAEAVTAAVVQRVWSLPADVLGVIPAVAIVANSNGQATGSASIVEVEGSSHGLGAVANVSAVLITSEVR